jgi:hypothetical protein
MVRKKEQKNTEEKNERGKKRNTGEKKHPRTLLSLSRRGEKKTEAKNESYQEKRTHNLFFSFSPQVWLSGIGSWRSCRN